jgi:ADP-heptose:LPS heptosyltransferase
MGRVPAATTEPTRFDPVAWCRGLVMAFEGDADARARSRDQAAEAAFPWYHALAAAHRQGIRAVMAEVVGDLSPAGVELELERERDLATAVSVVVADRARRVRAALATAGMASTDRVLTGDREVIVVAPKSHHGEIERVLAPLEPAGVRPVDGRVDRLGLPRIRVCASEPTPATWGELLARRVGDPTDGSIVVALAGDDPPGEPEPDVPPLPPPPAFTRPAAVERILAIRVGGIGDVLFALPAFEAIRASHPGARVTLLADTAQRDHLVRRSPVVDAVETFDWDLRDADPSRRDQARARFVASAGGHDLVVIIGPLVPVAGLDLPVPTLELRVERGRGHTARQLVEAAARAGYDADVDLPPRFDLHAAEVEDATLRIEGEEGARVPRPWLALAPGATTIYKAWPPERYAELARRWRDREGGTAILLPSPTEEPLAELIAARAGGSARVVPGVALVDLVPALAACDACAGNDTGPAHLAAALGLPTVVLYGFTDPAFTGPLGRRARTLGGIRQHTPGCEELIRSIDVDAVMAALLVT